MTNVKLSDPREKLDLGFMITYKGKLSLSIYYY